MTLLASRIAVMLPLAVLAGLALPFAGGDVDGGYDIQSGLMCSSVLVTMAMFWLHPRLSLRATADRHQMRWLLTLPSAVWFAASILAWFALLLLLGAPLAMGTLSLAMLEANLTLITISSQFPEWSEIVRVSRLVVVVGGGSVASIKENERAVVWAARGALVGLWLGALPLPLDWDAPWQRWPLPLYFASLALWMAASITR